MHANLLLGTPKIKREAVKAYWDTLTNTTYCCKAPYFGLITVNVSLHPGPIGAAASNVYGTRPVVMMGGFLSGLGFILASQATSLLHLYLTMGLISGKCSSKECLSLLLSSFKDPEWQSFFLFVLGLGWALVFTPTIASVMQYFTKRRSLAMGLGFTGVGLASFAFSPLFQYLVEAYAWRGALLILGGLSFNMVACGALIRPLGTPKVAVKVCFDDYKYCLKVWG